MATEKRLQLKTADHKALRLIYRKVEKHDTAYLTESYLQTLGVSVSQVGSSPKDDLDPTFKPKFFEPISYKTLKALLAKSCPDQDPVFRKFPTFPDHPDAFQDPLTRTHALNRYFSYRLEDELDDPEHPNLFANNCWYSKCGDDIRFNRPLYNFTDVQNWRVFLLFDACTPVKPHMMFMMTNEIEAKEDSLLQGELMAMIKVMHGRLPWVYFRENLVFPILIISFTGPQHARLVQGHFEEGKLRIQYTKLHDLRAEQPDTINLFLRYLMSEPVGDTSLKHIQ